ncbi:MAG: hypothetical protein ACO32I_07295, partial [Candidatus Limnocylindrus sp.]
AHAAVQARLKQFADRDVFALVADFRAECDALALLACTGPAPASSAHSQADGDMRSAIKHIDCGDFARARRLLLSSGLADLTDQTVLDELLDKHPQSRKPINDAFLADPSLERIEISEAGLSSVLRALDVNVAPGPNGWSNALLKALGLTDSFTDPRAKRVVDALRRYGELFANGDLPPWWNWLATAVREVGLKKPAPLYGTRPIGMGCRLRTAITRSIFTQDTRVTLGNLMAPIQVAVGVKAGITKAIVGVSLSLEEDDQSSAIFTDIANGFNTIERDAVVAAFADQRNPPNIRSLARLAYTTLTPASPILFGLGRARVVAPFCSVQGVQQGSAEGMPFFCFALAKKLEGLHLGPSVHIVAIADDMTVVGKPSETAAALQPIGAALSADLGLALQRNKSAWLAHPSADAAMRALALDVPRGEAPDLAPEAPPHAQPLAGVVYAGIPIGNTEYVRQQLDLKYAEIEAEILEIDTKLGAAYPQQRWLMLTNSSQFRLDYLLQHCKPEDTAAIAVKFDALLKRLVEAILGSSLASVPHGLERMHLPQRHSGLGLRSRYDLRDSAFTGAVAKALPALTDRTVDPVAGIVHEGILHTARIGNMMGQGSFDGTNYDFSTFLAANTRLGNAMQSSWQTMQQQAAPAGNAAPAAGALSADVSTMGHGIPNLQHATTTQLDNARFAALTHALPPHARSTSAIRATDSLSRAFLSCPGYVERLAPQVFRECLARYMAAPSPACAPLVGQPIIGARSDGGALIDAHGDNLLSACSDGNMEAKFRHDPLVDMLAAAAREAGGYSKAEDSSFFASVIPLQVRAAHAQQHGGTQHMRVHVPDITLQLDAGRGMELVEVKSISFCPTWYPRGAHDGANRRERTLEGEYLAKARALDRRFGLAQAAPGGGSRMPNVTIGPIEAKYLSVAPVRGAVIGGFGEGSNGLHRLIKDIAKAAGQKLYAQLGLSPEAAAALAKARLTRSVGTAMARGHAQMLLARLSLAAPLAAQRAVNRLRRQGHVLDMRSLEMETRAVLRGRGC